MKEKASTRRVRLCLTTIGRMVRAMETRRGLKFGNNHPYTLSIGRSEASFNRSSTQISTWPWSLVNEKRNNGRQQKEKKIVEKFRSLVNSSDRQNKVLMFLVVKVFWVSDQCNSMEDPKQKKRKITLKF